MWWITKLTRQRPPEKTFKIKNMSERTLVLVKPDGVERGLIGEVISRMERKGFKIVALEMRTLERSIAETHYAEHVDKPFFKDLVDFISGGPLVAAVIEKGWLKSFWMKQKFSSLQNEFYVFTQLVEG